MIGKGLNIGNIPPVANGHMVERQAAYCVAHKMLINPDSKPFTGVYGAAGPDLTTPLLMFDPSEVIAVDLRRVVATKFAHHMRRWKRTIPGGSAASSSSRISDRCGLNYWREEVFIKYAEELIVTELKMLGVDKNKVRYGLNRDNDIEIEFPWAYPGNKPRMRKFTYIARDITEPSAYPESLKRLLAQGVDFYYQKCALDCLLYADSYIRKIASATRAAMVISPVTNLGGDYVRNASKLVRLLGREFKYVGSINDSYRELFLDNTMDSAFNYLYNWLVEYWQRNGNAQIMSS